MTMKTIANENDHADHLQLKQSLEEAEPLMLPMFPGLAESKESGTFTSSSQLRLETILSRRCTSPFFRR
jgi:hypothetical protein